MCQALLPALRHAGLHIFRTNAGIFVTPVQPKSMAPDQFVEPIRNVLEYLNGHPGCIRQDLINDLSPRIDSEPSKAAEILNPLRWLIERGHVVEFFDGSLAVLCLKKEKGHR